VIVCHRRAPPESDGVATGVTLRQALKLSLNVATRRPAAFARCQILFFESATAS
jgi:hypothetical protein